MINPVVATPESLSTWMKECQAHVELALDKFLPSDQVTPTHLHEAMRYAALGGGKRVRPLLVLAAGQLVNADENELLRAACAVEMIHVYSLVHDDMPCMDDDTLRRGKPTVHIQYDDATALLVGDALQAQAFLVLTQGKTPPERQLDMLTVLARASGSLGMCGGQAIDLASVGHPLSKAQLEQMHQLKTGALLSASVLLGVLCGRDINAAERHALERYSKAIGLAFQVVDDVLDATSNSATLGKTAGKDAASDKPTYVSILGLDASKVLAENLRIEAHNALQELPLLNTLRLNQLADFIVQRCE